MILCGCVHVMNGNMCVCVIGWCTYKKVEESIQVFIEVCTISIYIRLFELDLTSNSLRTKNTCN